MKLLASSMIVAMALGDSSMIKLNNGIEMPRINLGTCCGSSPSAGLPSWISAGGVGIDTAYDYQDQADIKKILGRDRSKFFITTKIPAGFGQESGDCRADPNVALDYLKKDIEQLGVQQVDLVLLHAPCELFQKGKVENATASNNALWQGLQEALSKNLTRAIGVSNYNSDILAALGGPVPAVNQCEMSINGSFGQPGHDDKTIAYCAKKGITYESYGAMKGCPFSDTKTQAIAAAHKKSVAQVCLRWVLDRGAIIASGTGADATAAAGYAKENLDIFDFTLSSSDMKYLDDYKHK
jgi:diketogulonate reductase-like aldo/keto reductase